jgi:hypothetical protein
MHDTSRRIETTPQTVTATATRFESTIIPSSFMLGGLTIEVVRDETMVRTKSLIGEARYNEQVIRIDTGAAPLQTVEQTFIHELVHWIFYLMNEDELRNNEKLVDLFSHFLYQALVTAKHEPDASSKTSCSDEV